MTDRGGGTPGYLVVLGLLVVVAAIGWYFLFVALPGVPRWVKGLVGVFAVVALVFMALRGG